MSAPYHPNPELRKLIDDGTVTVTSCPARMRVSLDWLKEHMGCEPRFGDTIAIGRVSPIIYKISGAGWGNAGPATERYKDEHPLHLFRDYELELVNS